MEGPPSLWHLSRDVRGMSRRAAWGTTLQAEAESPYKEEREGWAGWQGTRSRGAAEQGAQGQQVCSGPQAPTESQEALQVEPQPQAPPCLLLRKRRRAVAGTPCRDCSLGLGSGLGVPRRGLTV